MARVELIGPASQSVLECDHYTASRRHLAPQPLQNSRSLNHKELLFYASVAAGAFHLAWTFPIFNVLALIYAWALMQIAA
ncbi:MAG: hypothetical protein ACXW3Z_16340, partial [Limisphaerales bacterium]